ncbi:head maturation protease, ClpP-related [Schleiferilactobacillus harbinensis]|uniref:head maturation protease, ClpP-related n=1 Tax=Schleiferilactobacillus harbinensis TaxID=304207 RepID=UPI0039E95BFB
MAVTVPIKGVISSEDDAEVYQLFGYSTVTPSDLAGALAQAGDQAVTLEINSPGGDVFAGSEMATAIKNYTGKVEADIVGLAASAASVVALAANKVMMAPTAQLMIHRAAMTADGNVDVMDGASQALNSIDQTLVDVYTAKTGMSQSDVYALMEKETWLNPKSAVDKGFADGIMFAEAPVATNATLVINPTAIASVKHLLAEVKWPKKPIEKQDTQLTPSQPKAISPKLALLLGIKNKEAK